jgi:ribosome biogenesis GTPase / thiamine phosphate phosphatase
VNDEIEGEIVSGINSIYVVDTVDGRLLCSIKGKRLGTDTRFHNPIAPGDRVTVRRVPSRSSARATQGTVVGLLERRTVLSRWNKKTRSPQLLAANARTILCVTSTASPAFRPRFLDRLIIAGESGGLEPVIVVNKADLGMSEEVEDRLAAYEELGYPVVVCSAQSGRGIDALVERLGAGLAVMAGQSGVGKSSLLNRLEPGLDLRVGGISQKYDRGVHTTVASLLYRLAGGAEVIDTPGMRELELCGIAPAELRQYYRDFAGPAAACEYDTCLHVDEDRCGVRDAVESGVVHADRYESYLRTYEQVCESDRARREQATGGKRAR